MNGNRHEDPHMADAPTDFDDSLISSVADAVETCLNRREDIQPVLSEIRNSTLRGEPAQSQLNELLDAEPALAGAGIAAARDDFEELLAATEDNGELSEADVNDFMSFWGRNEWIEAGVEAYRKGNAHGSTFWTSVGLDCHRRNNRVYVQHQLEWGLDEVHDIDAPLDTIWNDLLARLKAIMKKLEDEEMMGESEARFLANSKQTVEEIYAHLDSMDVDDELEDEANEGMRNGDGDSTGDGEASGDSSLDGLFGTSDEDDRDESHLGFA